VSPFDAIVVGAGPNGLAAALTLARAGLRVHVYEGAPTPGGGCRTQELTLPGYRHDVCSAVHPLLRASSFFQTVDWAGHGVRLLSSPVAFAHPLDDGRSAALIGSVAETASGLGVDGRAYQRLMTPLVAHTDDILATFLAPLRSLPAHPLSAARMGLPGLASARHLARRFDTDEGKAMVAGTAAHSMLPLTAPLTGVFPRLFTMLAHAVGWPVVEGGSTRVIDAMVAELAALGAEVECGQWVQSLDELGPASAVVLDVTPRQLVALGGERVQPRYRRALQRFLYGSGVCKVDWALSGPVPWTSERCRQAVTLHLGGTFAEIARSEAEVNQGRHPEYPYCLVAQPCVVDPSRAPTGHHTLWAYCHVPNGSDVDMTARMEAQIERFAPGFRDLIVGRSTSTAAVTELHNPSYVGGDINAGAASLRQTLFRPTPQWNPYRTALKGVYLCSASTPPGGGVHGLCGMHAARTVLHDLHVTGTEMVSMSA
jgi:phytoene dehydrogenase-like protein